MARNRTFKWVDPSGNTLVLTDRPNGFWVMKGVTGLGMPDFVVDKEALPTEGDIIRGVRPSGRTIFIPMEVSGAPRLTFLQRKQNMGYMFDPSRGDGYLYVTDGGVTYRVRARYSSGLTGDESDAAGGEEGTTSWEKIGLNLDADPFFEMTSPSVIGPYGYSSGIPFFPILPMSLSTAQVLSDISQPVVTNRLTNPSFETGTIAGWSGVFFSSPTVIGTPSTLWPMSGAWSCRLDFPPAVGGDSGTFYTSADAVPLVIGQKYTIKLRVVVPSGQPPVRISAWDGASNYTQLNDQPEWLVSEFVAGFSPNPLLAIAQQAGANANGGYCFIDQGMLVLGSDPGGYIDGAQPNCHWTGTANASTSYRDPTYAPTTIINSGTRESWPVINVAGPGTVIDLYHRDKDQHVTLNHPITAGQVVTFDMGNKRVTLANDDTNLFQYLTADDFWSLTPNKNLVSLSLSSAAVGSRIDGYFHARLDSIV